jgi:hypothetical protein
MLLLEQPGCIATNKKDGRDKEREQTSVENEEDECSIVLINDVVGGLSLSRSVILTLKNLR